MDHHFGTGFVQDLDRSRAPAPPRDIDGDLTRTLFGNGHLVPIGKDQIADVSSGNNGRWYQSLTFSFCERENLWDLLQFFDSRRGRLLPFWTYAPVPFFEFDDITATYVDVADTFDPADVASALTYVAVVLKDGTVEIRPVSGAAIVGQSIRISVSTNFSPPAAADVDYVTMGMMCRFDSDVMQETWYNDENCDVTLPMIEVHEEQDHSVTNIEYTPGVEFSNC